MRWLSWVFRRKRVEAELDAELRDHVERHVADSIVRGMSEPEARRLARIQFGGIEQMKELCRDARGTRWLDDTVQDIRYGVRMLRRQPAFTAAALLSLALGIGANAAIFTLVDATLLKPLPVRSPGELVEILTDRGGGSSGNAFSYQALAHFREHATTVDVIASHQSSFFVGLNGAAPEPATGQYVTGDFFTVLGVGAAMGRTIVPSDDRQDAAPAVVLGHRYWQRRFGGDDSAIGRTLTIDGQPFTVIGVAPQGFRGLVVTRDVDVWVPLAAEPVLRSPSWTSSAGYKWLQLVGRMKSGVGVEEARAEITALFRAAAVEPDLAMVKDPAARERYERWVGVVVSARSGLSSVRQQYGEPLLVLLGISGLVLLVACMNAANLLMARATARRHEMAVRFSLGARRTRVVRQLLTESLLLSLGGAAAGILIAYGACTYLLRFFATTRAPVTLDVSPDARVLAFTIGISLLTALVFGLAPAWRAVSAAAPATSLQSSVRLTAGREKRALGRILLVAQVAMSIVMLFCGGLFLRSLHNLRSIDVGFDSSAVLIVSGDVSRAGLHADALRALYRNVVTRLAAVPGVRSASVSQVTPIFGGGTELTVHVEGPGARERTEARGVYMNWVSPGYFQTTGTPVQAGRDFTWQDTPANTKVVLVNQTMARRYFGPEGAIGGRLTLFGDTYEIVGVTGDAKYIELRESMQPTVYFHWDQQGDAMLTEQNVRLSQFAVRTAAGSPHAMAAAVRHALRDAAPSLTVTKVWSLDEQVNASITRERLLSLLSGCFAGLGLLLAAIGLYGVTSYAVTRRTSEIGIRMALGANGSRIARMVAREAAIVTGCGIILGIAAALLLSRVLASLLFEVTPRDPWTAAAVSGLMLLTALTAAAIPSRRAARVDPTVALRSE